MNKMTYKRHEDRAEFGFLNTFLKDLKRRRIFVYGITAAATLVTLVVVLILPNTYTASVKIMPESSNRTDQLAMMASSILPQSVLAATSLSKGGGEGATIEALVSSNRVVDSVLLHRFAPAGGAQEASLYELWQPANLEYGRREFASHFGFRQNAKSGLITLSFESADPELSAQVANVTAEHLDMFKGEIDRRSAKQNADYLTQRIAEASAKLESAELERESFLNKNRNYRTSTDPTLTTTIERLERTVAFYNQMVLTLKQAQTAAEMESQNMTPRLSIVESAQAPLIKSGPPRTKYLLMGLIAGLLFGIGWIMVQTAYVWYFPSDTRIEFSESLQLVEKDMKGIVNRISTAIRSKEGVGV